MRFKRIPKRWLIHSVTLTEKKSEDGAFGNVTVTDGITVSHVRVINPRSGLNVSGDNEQRTVDAILLHQPGVSDDCTFDIGGHVRFAGQLYEIVGVDPIYELERLHHTEVKLSYVC